MRGIIMRTPESVGLHLYLHGWQRHDERRRRGLFNLRVVVWSAVFVLTQEGEVSALCVSPGCCGDTCHGALPLQIQQRPCRAAKPLTWNQTCYIMCFRCSARTDIKINKLIDCSNFLQCINKPFHNTTYECIQTELTDQVFTISLSLCVIPVAHTTLVGAVFCRSDNSPLKCSSLFITVPSLFCGPFY